MNNFKDVTSEGPLDDDDLEEAETLGRMGVGSSSWEDPASPGPAPTAPSAGAPPPTDEA